jgi:F0F1-type ATP synthase epsilon subunit
MDTLEAIVRKRDGVIFQGNVFALSSINEIGPFDILADHANFVCTIKESLTIHQTKDKKEEIKIDTGILSVKENKVEVFIGI